MKLLNIYICNFIPEFFDMFFHAWFVYLSYWKVDYSEMYFLHGMFRIDVMFQSLSLGKAGITILTGILLVSFMKY